MLKKEDSSQKLIPLRKFAIPGVYSSAYLSQLVQRKKLRAKKIGRNYYSCQDWFDDYLALHAQDRKQAEYNKYLADNKTVKEVNLTKSTKVFKFNLMAVSTAIFILSLLFVNFIYFINKNGEVAGVSEESGAAAIVASSTEGLIIK